MSQPSGARAAAKRVFRRAWGWIAPPLTIAALAGAVYGFYHLTFDARAEARAVRLASELARVRGTVERVAEEVDAYDRQIALLRGETEESLYHARTGLGLVRRGEVVYQFTETPPTEAALP